MNQQEQPQQTYRSLCTITAICQNIALSSFFFGYCMVFIGALPIETLMAVYSIPISPSTASGLINGLTPVGALLGALLSSLLISRFSRRQCLLLVNGFGITASILIFVPSFGFLLFFRFCQGVTVGFNSVLAPLIINQMAPIQISGSLGALRESNLIFAQFFGPALTYGFKKMTGDPSCEQFWYIMFLVPLALLLIQTSVLLWVFPYETPKYLLSIRSQEEAQLLIQILYKQEYVETVLEQKKKDLGLDHNRQYGRKVQLIPEEDEQAVAEGSSSKIGIVLAASLMFIQQFAGMNCIVIYGTSIAQTTFTGQLVLIFHSLVNFTHFVFTALSSVLMLYYGRRTILLAATLALTLILAMIVVGFKIKDEHELGVTIIIVGLFVFTAVYGASLGPIGWLMMPELVQPSTVPYIAAANWSCTSLVVLLFPIIKHCLPHGNPAPIFMVFCVCCAGTFAFYCKYMVQTKHKTEEEIQHSLAMMQIC